MTDGTLSDWARHKPLHDAVLAEARHGRDWPFAVGDQVRVREAQGCESLRIYTDPGTVLTVYEVADGGRWLSLRGEDGHRHCGFGPSYFRIAGECGGHFPGYRNPDWRVRQVGAYFCLRCDEPMPEVTRVLLGDLLDKESGDG